MPSPSQKPVKCRFTAVLPSKSSPQYANVDSYLNPIISSSSSCEASDDTPPISDNSCSTVLSQSSTSQEISRPDNVNLGSSNTERDSSAREPLINTTPNHEVIESANTIQLYSRMPSPNPFTMDRLLGMFFVYDLKPTLRFIIDPFHFEIYGISMASED